MTPYNTPTPTGMHLNSMFFPRSTPSPTLQPQRQSHNVQWALPLRYTPTWAQVFCPLFLGPSDCPLQKSPEKNWERTRYTSGSWRTVGGFGQDSMIKTDSRLKEYPCLELCGNSPLEPSDVLPPKFKEVQGSGN